MSATLPLPKRCPKCTSVRWNQRYLDEELALIDRIQDELYETGLIKESGESIEYEGNEALGKEPNRNPSLRFLPGYLNYSASVKIVGFLISNI